MVDLRAIQEQMLDLELKPKLRSHQSFSGFYESVFKGSGANFSEVRPYFAGDDVRRLHWRASARSKDMQIRLDQEEREIQVHFVVEQNDRFLWSSTRLSKAERIAQLVGVLGTCALRSGDAIGLTLFKGRQVHQLRPRRSQSQLWTFVEECCNWSQRLPQVISREESCASLNHALGAFAERHWPRSCVVLVSSFEGEDWHEEVLQLGQRHDILPVCVLDPRELDCGAGGLLTLEDGEQQVVADLSSKKVQARFAHRSQEQLQSKIDFFEAMGCELLVQRRSEMVLKDLMEYLQKRDAHSAHGGLR